MIYTIPIALIFDFIALIPIVGLITNPMFTHVLYLYYGPESTFAKNFKKSLGTSLVVNAAGDLMILFSWLPTNVGQAVYGGFLDKMDKSQEAQGATA